MTHNHTKKRRVFTGLANNNMPKQGEYTPFSTNSYSQVKFKKSLASTKNSIRHSYNQGNLFGRFAVHITDYSKLVIGEKYHIGTGEVGNHAYYFTGTFNGLDENGGAIFENYSQKNNDGNKYKNVKTVTIKPPSLQKRKLHIYKLQVRSKLPNNIQSLIRSFGTQKRKRSPNK